MVVLRGGRVGTQDAPSGSTPSADSPGRRGRHHQQPEGWLVETWAWRRAQPLWRWLNHAGPVADASRSDPQWSVIAGQFSAVVLQKPFPEFARPAGRGLHRVHERRAQPSSLQGVEPGDGGTTGAGHLVLEATGVLPGLDEELG